MGIGLHEHSVTSALNVSEDHSVTATGSSVNPATGTCIVSQAGTLVLAGFAEGSANLATITVAGSFTAENKQTNASSAEAQGTADDVNASASEGATFTVNTSVAWAAMAISFKTSAATVIPWWEYCDSMMGVLKGCSI